MYKLLTSAVVGCILLLFAGGDFCNGQDFNDLSFVQLEKQLNAILKTRLAEEKAYVSKVVKLVKLEKIPRRLVNSSFEYVRKKRPFTNHPFVYFVRVLQFQGAKEKIAIPKFDFKIYSVPNR